MTETIPNRPTGGCASVLERLRALDETQGFAALATNERGRPYSSLIAFALTPDGRRIIFATPRETRKYRNILESRSVSLLVDNRTDVRSRLMDTEAVTVIGRARAVPPGRLWNELAAVLLKKHPDLSGFVQSESTALVAVRATRCIHVGRFQTVSVWSASAPSVRPAG
jgi:nitroimidazol reductase NimA-like FMN-containing flavoprotein (pyridoxamine 5'-phosphate oxidase superfamily)